NHRFASAVIIDYGETVAPAGEPGQLPAEDRSSIVTLRRWASDPLFLHRSVTFCLLSETTAALSAPLVGDARTFEIAVSIPAGAGHEGAKWLFRETARALAQGRLDVVPMGYLVCGPVGTGKSFIVRCFAKEIGIPVVELLNFRSKWQGQTEANLERVLGLLDAIGPVAVVVDEADAALGTRETGGADSGVSERVFASLAAFMGHTRRRVK